MQIYDISPTALTIGSNQNAQKGQIDNIISRGESQNLKFKILLLDIILSPWCRIFSTFDPKVNVRYCHNISFIIIVDILLSKLYISRTISVTWNNRISKYLNSNFDNIMEDSKQRPIIWCNCGEICPIFMHQMQGIPQQPGTGQIARLIAFFPGYFVLKKLICQSESKIQLCFAYWFFRIPPSTLELSRPT